ncbi:MAG: hypothetical protein VW453_11885, partial [Rhodospirillaceae bacterium]
GREALLAAALGTGPVADVESACKLIVTGKLVMSEPAPVRVARPVPATDERYASGAAAPTDDRHPPFPNSSFMS